MTLQLLRCCHSSRTGQVRFLREISYDAPTNVEDSFPLPMCVTTGDATF
jgi:hypothetical protein